MSSKDKAAKDSGSSRSTSRAGAPRKPVKQRSWEDVVAEGVKEGTVVKSEPAHQADRDAGITDAHPEGNTVELIVENFHGIKRATGIGPTHAKARETLVENLKAFTGNSGPVVEGSSAEMNGTETAEALNQAEKDERAGAE